MQNLDHIFSRHKHWISVVKRFGEINYAEDIVHEAYIKVIDLDKVINEAYFYYTLRSLTMNLHNKKIIKVEITNDIEQLLVEPEDFEYIYELATPILEFIKTWDSYEQILFMLWVNKQISMRKMARESGISFTSIYNTITNCKKRIIQWQKENQKA
jgi:DNA-directed RNA polymerase specialized sigma24 family protein